jgi:hypothetical protein
MIRRRASIVEKSDIWPKNVKVQNLIVVAVIVIVIETMIETTTETTIESMIDPRVVIVIVNVTLLLIVAAEMITQKSEVTMIPVVLHRLVTEMNIEMIRMRTEVMVILVMVEVVLGLLQDAMVLPRHPRPVNAHHLAHPRVVLLHIVPDAHQVLLEPMVNEGLVHLDHINPQRLDHIVHQELEVRIVVLLLPIQTRVKTVPMDDIDFHISTILD